MTCTRLSFSRFVVLAIFLIMFALHPSVTRADVTFNSSLVADFEFNIVPGGPLAGAGFPVGVFIPFQAVGSLLFALDDAVANPVVVTALFVSATGVLDGVAPVAFLPYQISPIEFLGGDLTNIMRDGGGNITSATVDQLSMKWELTGSPGGIPLRLYTRVGLPFDAQVTSIPFEVGTVLAGPADFEIFLDVGLRTGDPLAVIGRNRTLTVVPEPACLAALATSVGLLACRCRKPQRA